MKYFQIAGWVLFVGLTLWWFYRSLIKIRTDFYFKTTSRRILKKQLEFNSKSYFSSQTIRDVLSWILRSRQRRKKYLNLFSNGEWDDLKKDLQKYKNVTALSLTAFFNPQKAEKETQQLLKQKVSPKDKTTLLLLAAELSFNRQDNKNAQKYLEKADVQNLKGYQKAKFLFLEAILKMQEGDLLTASENCSRAIIIFNKTEAYYEVAEAYLLMGTLYRISAVEDVAQIMLQSAQEIFKQLRAGRQEGEVLGHLGMLMVMQNRFEEADSYFQKANALFEQNDLLIQRAEIINQTALSALIRNDYLTAAAKADEAYRLHHNADNISGEALSLEILSRIDGALGKWQEAAAKALQAQKLYRRSHNISGELEARLLEAQAIFQNEEFSRAEKLLRLLIEREKKSPSCFHVANAYNLLGLIFMKKGDLQRAKGLFQQSLDNEMRNNRCQGMAVDYANMALIEYRRGHLKEADEAAKIALEWAQTYGKDDTYELLETTLAKAETLQKTKN